MTLLFGGMGERGSLPPPVLWGWDGTTSGDSVLTDTWEWDGARWHRVASAGGPSDRHMAGIVYDAERRVVLVFGGYEVTAQRMTDDLWAWDGSAWTRLAEHGPGPRGGVGIGFDGRRRTVVVHRGMGPNGGGSMQDTWEWNGKAWRQASEAGPAVAAWSAMAGPPSGDLFLFGGWDGSAAGSDLWRWTGAAWAKVPVASGPSARLEHSLAYDTARSRLVLYGGTTPTTGAKFGDLWEFDGTAWSLRRER